MDIQQEFLVIETLWDKILKIEKIVRDRHDWLSDQEFEAWEEAKNNQEPFWTTVEKQLIQTRSERKQVREIR